MQKPLVVYGIFVVLFVAGSFHVSSQGTQTARIDSLLAKLRQHPGDDTARVNLYNKISYEYYLQNSRKGIETGLSGAVLAEKLNYSHGLIFCLISTGACYWAVAEYPKALETLLRALKLAEETKNKSGIARASGNLGNVYAELPNYPKALEYYNKALTIAVEMNDIRGMARNQGNIGTICKEMQSYPKALEYYSKALKNYEAAGEKRGISVTLANIGWVYADLSKYPDALVSYSRSLKIAKKIGERRVMMYDYGNIGEVYYKMATDTSAGYRHSRDTLSESKKKSYLKLSIEYTGNAAEIAADINADKQLFSWYLNLSHAYKQLEDWEKAYRYAQLSYVTKDSVFTQENSLKMAKMDTDRESELKEKELQLQKARLETANLQRIALAGGLIGLIVILLLIYQSRRKSERLLRNMLPATIARRLKKRENVIADRFENAAVVFIDIAGFTTFSSDKTPEYIVEVLTGFFTRMDSLADKHRMEKIKTIGDRYMAVSGLPEPSPGSVETAAKFALESCEVMRTYKTHDGLDLRVRIGIDAGEVVAGIIGDKRFSYDLWGDVVNTASRMESLGVVGEVQITDRVRKKLDGKFNTRERGEIDVKGKGSMKTWLLQGVSA
ncbi:MAG: adenylate/guanylate cyclase domain-containing protein [bacterium]